jgi:hypothetical protein
MTLSDVIVGILIEGKRYENRVLAHDVVFQTFRKEYPYWAYSDWNVVVSPTLARILIKHFSTKDIDIANLILDLPPLVDRFKLSAH